MNLNSPNNSLLYGLDDRPPWGRSIVLGGQHVLTMFGSTVAVPLMFGPALWPIPPGIPSDLAARLMEVQLANTALLISSVMLCSGVATLLQSTFGSRLPIVQGVSFSFLAAFFGIIATVQTNMAPDWSPVVQGTAVSANVEDIVNQWQSTGAVGMQTIAGAIIVGGVIEAFVGFTGMIGLFGRVLSPVVIGPVIMLIGLALYQFGAPVAASHWPIALLTMFLIILFSLVLSRHVRFFRLFPMLSAIGISMAVCGWLTYRGNFQHGDPGYVDLSAINRSSWFRLTTLFFPWGLPQFGVSALVAVLAGYLASIIESFGDYHACKHMAGGGDPTPDEISRGIGFEGIACSLTGIFGGFSSTSYSENIGLVGLTKVGSRHVVQMGAAILIVLGLFGKFGALAAGIPQPVVGGLYCTLFGLIAAVGIQQFAKADLTSNRNLFIGGFALFMGLSVPFYFSDFSTGRTDIYENQWLHALAEGPREAVQTIMVSLGTTGMAVAVILGIFLDNIIPGSRVERGLDQSTSD